MIRGFDLSYYQWSLKDNVTGGRYYVPIEYAKAKAAGIEFAFLKACDGIADNPLYAEAMKQARESGMRAAPYVWLYQGNAAKQAEFWYSRLKDEPLIVIDFEHYQTSYPTAADLKTAILRLREIGYTGKITIYTGHWYWKDWGSNDPFFAQFPVWLARYSIYEPQETPPWTNWNFWQYTGSANPVPYGITNGVSTLDLDYFAGTIEQLNQLFGTPTAPPIGGTTMLLTSLEDGLRVRTGPGVTFPSVTVAPFSYNAGQSVEVIALDGTGSPEQWAKIADGRWVNVWHAGYQNARLSGTLPPPSGAGATVEMYANGALIHSANVAAGGKIRIDVVD